MEDAHAAAHARAIEARFAGRRNVTTGEILWFGFTGGLLPCPAAIAVMLVCLQLREVSLGIAMVAAFSTGLAATLVSIGVLAAWSTRRAAHAWPGTKRYYGTSGNSFVAAVEFGPKVRAIAVTAGGESGDPKSPHFDDEAQRYASGNLREVYFYPDQLNGHVERRYHPGD